MTSDVTPNADSGTGPRAIVVERVGHCHDDDGGVIAVYECNECGALMTWEATGVHRAWHLSAPPNDGSGSTP